MTSKIIKRNVEVLQGLARGANEDVKARVDKVVEWYKTRKISQRETAKKFINDLTNDNKRSVTFAKKRFDKKYEEIEGRAPLNERMSKNRDKKDYVIRYQLYGLNTGQITTALKDNQGQSHNLLSMPQPIQLNLKNVRDEDKLDETLVGKYVLSDRFDLWTRDLKYRLKLKKGNANKITRKEFDKLNTREEWRKETGISEEPRKRKNLKGRFKEFDVIHNSELFQKLLNRLVKKNTELIQQYPSVQDYTTAIKIMDISDVSNSGGGKDETKKKLKNGGDIGMYHYTINTEIYVKAENFVRAIQNADHENNMCWINTLSDHYKDTLMSENKWQSKRMTREKIFGLMNVSEEEFRKNGASVEDMKPVFEEFKLTVRLYNFLGQKVFSYEPVKKNKNVSVLFGLIKGNHIYTMNDNIMSISRRDFQENMKLCASTDFHLNSKEKPVKYEFFNDINDVMKIVENNEEEGEVNLVSNKSLNSVYCEFHRAGYEAKIIMGACGNIASLKFKFNKLVLNIRSQSLIDCAVDTCITSKDAVAFNAVNEAFFNFNKGMFNPNHKSYYNNDDLNIFSMAHTLAPSGYMKPIAGFDNKHIELDRRKAYTKSTMDIVKIPVFSEFDIWQKYDCEKNCFNKMNGLTLYLVKSKVKNMFFNRTYNLIYGKFLKKYADKVEIIYYKVPSNVYKVNYKKLVEELWSLKLDEDEEKDKLKKKMIACINIGLLEKSSNTAKKSIAFSKMVDAFYYQEKYGGSINIISEIQEDRSIDGYTTVYDSDEEEEVEVYNSGIVGEEKHYVLNISDTKKLMNGYKFIKELILQHHNFDMNEAYEQLIGNDVEVYSVKTDAFVIDKGNLCKARKLLKFGGEIGEWRYSDKFKFPHKAFNKQCSILCGITEYENECGVVKDEWNTDEIIDEHILNNKRLMIRASLPGSGKSYICKHLQNRGYKVLFVVPTNNLKQECGVEAMKINKFFGISYGDERLEKFDCSDYDVIVFDEIYFHNVGKWALIWNYCKNNPDKIVLATGDTKQLKNPETVSNTISFEKYADHCIDLIFKNNIMLYECKRLKTEEDRNKLKEIKRLIFDNEPILNIIEKYFGWADGSEICENNIAYTNKTCKEVSNKIRKMKGIEDEYVIGEEVICRKYVKTKGTKFNVNFKFRISNIVGNIVVLQNVATDVKQNIDIKVLRKHFIYAYAYTCHSKQGCSIDDDIVIYDWSKWYCCKNWYWTSITRARDLNRVKFYKYDTDENDMSKIRVETYFKNKVMSYIEQDERAGRNVNDGEFVDVEFLMSLMNTNCENCNEQLTVDFDNDKVVSNISCQRICNELGHFKDNVIGYCVSCNCAFSDKIKSV